MEKKLTYNKCFISRRIHKILRKTTMELITSALPYVRPSVFIPAKTWLSWDIFLYNFTLGVVTELYLPNLRSVNIRKTSAALYVYL
jgi:hypothetical protein